MTWACVFPRKDSEDIDALLEELLDEDYDSPHPKVSVSKTYIGPVSLPLYPTVNLGGT